MWNCFIANKLCELNRIVLNIFYRETEQEQMAPWTKEAIGQITSVCHLQYSSLAISLLCRQRSTSFSIQSSLDGFDGVPAAVNSGESL